MGRHIYIAKMAAKWWRFKMAAHSEVARAASAARWAPIG